MADIHTDDQSQTDPQAALLPGAVGARAEDAGEDTVETGGAVGARAEDAREDTVETGGAGGAGEDTMEKRGGVNAQLEVLRENTEKFELATDLMVLVFTSLGISAPKIKYGVDFAKLMGYAKLPTIDPTNKNTHHHLLKGMYFSFKYDELPDQDPKVKNFFSVVKDSPNSFLAKAESAPMFFVYHVVVSIGLFDRSVTLHCFPISAMQHIKTKLQNGGYKFKEEVSPSSFMDTIMGEIQSDKDFFNKNLKPIQFSLNYSLLPASGNLFGRLFAEHVKCIECLGYIAQGCMTETNAKPTKKHKPEANSTLQLKANAKAVEAAMKGMHTLRYKPSTAGDEALHGLRSTLHTLETMRDYTFHGVEFPPDTLRDIIDRIRMSTGLNVRHDTTSEKLRTMRNLVNYLCELRLEDLDSGTFRDLTQQIEDFLRTAALQSMHKIDPSQVGDFVKTICDKYPFYPPMKGAIASYEDAEELIHKYAGYFPIEIMKSKVPDGTTGEAFAAMALELAKCTKPQACKDAPTEDQRTEANYHIALYYKQHWNPDYIPNSMKGAMFYLMLHCHPQLCSFGCEREVFRLLVHLRFFDKYKDSKDLLALLKDFAEMFLAEKGTTNNRFTGVWVPPDDLSPMLDAALKRADQAAAAEAAKAKADAKAKAAAKKKATRKKRK